MFTLAHLSDPHLAPLPGRAGRELIGKRITGYINWQRKRRFIHDARVLDKIVADLKAQGARPHRGHRRHRQYRAAGGIRARPRLAGRPRLAADVSFVPGNHDVYVRGAVAGARALGRLYARRRRRQRLSLLRRRGPLALIGLSTAVPTAPFMATGRLGAAQLARLGEIARRRSTTRSCSASC